MTGLRRHDMAYFHTMEYSQFLHVPIWITDDAEEGDVLPPKTYRRIICIPFESIAYMMEGINRGTTEVTLNDGDLLICEMPFNLMTSVWEEWHASWQNNFMTFTRKN